MPFAAFIPLIAAVVGQLAQQQQQQQAGVQNAAAGAAQGAGKGGGIQMDTPVTSKIQDAIASANTAATEGPKPPMTGLNVMDKMPSKSILDVQKLPEQAAAAGPLQQAPKDGKGFFGDMSTADKMAFAASIGSLMRGPGAPPPPGAPSGGQGIQMDPVFLRQLYGG
jgi:hypothetical protein